MGDVVKLDDARAARQAKRRRLALVLLAGFVLALALVQRPLMADNPNYTPSDSRYAVGYVDRAAVARFFEPDPDTGVATYAQRGYYLTPIDSPAVEHDIQYAVYPDGRVERAYLVASGNPFAADISDDNPAPGPGIQTASELAALGVDPDAVDVRAPLMQQYGRYWVGAVKRPHSASDTFGDFALGKVITIAFNVIASIFAPGGAITVGAAQAVTGQNVDSANDRIRERGISGGFSRSRVELENYYRERAGGNVTATASPLSIRAAAAPAAHSRMSASAQSWLQKHAGDTPFLAWLSKVVTHGG